MQPKLLSVEPVVLLSLGVLICLIIPVFGFVSHKASANLRTLIVSLGVPVLCAYFLWLGQAVGLSKAWYHWREQYQRPMEKLQIFISDAHSNKNDAALDQFHQKFIRENIQAYGREPLLSSTGSFSTLVQSLKASTNSLNTRHP